jgi:hypothetical protein
MAEVAQRAAALAAVLPGPSLAAFAAVRVRPAEATDPRCGEIWAEDSLLSRLMPRLLRAPGQG